MSRIDHYRACAARGMSINETARLHGVTPHAVRLANRLHNLGFGVTRAVSDRDLIAMRERVEAMAQQGWSQKAVSIAINVPLNTIKRWTREWGVQWKRQGGKTCYVDRLRQHLTPAQIDDLKLFHRKRFTYREALVLIRRPDLLEYLP